MTNAILFDKIESPFAHALAEYVGKTYKIQEDITYDAPDVTRAVFDIGAWDEGAEIDRVLEDGGVPEDFLGALESAIKDTMEGCRSLLGMAGTRAEQFQIWALAVDDVAARQYGLPETPLFNQARLSCIKALAKEYGRMGIAFNVCFIHPTREMLSSDQIKKSRSTMKPFVLRYKPEPTNSVAKVLGDLILQDTLPMNGSALYLTNGGMELSS